MISDILIVVFGGMAIIFALLVVVLRQPMRAALALIAHMASLAAIFACLEVHVVAVFQVLIYVGAVMVFMVYAIMLLDPRDPSRIRSYSRLLVPGVVAGALFLGALAYGLWHALPAPSGQAAVPASREVFKLHEFAAAFVNEYWLLFELTSVLLLAAVVAALAVINVSRRSRG
jgi:NADH-quinone oxidoreductase subunit J